MRFLAALRSFASALFHHSRLESEMDEELRAHLHRRADDLERSGLPRSEAERRARLDFGGYQKFKEECREAVGTHFIETLVQDVRYAFRILRKSPGFTTIAVLTLALGIGANTAAFSMVNALILHPYNFPQLDRLVRVWEDRGAETGFDQRYVAPADADQIRNATAVFSGLTTYRFRSFTLGSGASVEHVLGCAVSAEFFDVLQVTPLLGRTFAPEEDRPGRADVVVASYGFWQRQFAGRPVLGNLVQLDGRSFTIIGVMPKEFDYPVPVELWVPLALTPAERADRAALSLQALGRLQSGVSAGQARAVLDTLARRLANEYPSTNSGRRATALQLRRELYQFTLPLFLLLQAAAAFVMFLACANLANLLFARILSRQREIALRVSLGADRSRLARLFLSETLLFSAFAGLIAIAVSFWSIKLLRTSISPSWTKWVPGWDSIRPDHFVLAFTIALTLAIGLLFGLLTVIHSGRVDLNKALKDTGAGMITPAKAKLRSAMVVAQVAFALVLLVCAGLTIQGFVRLSRVYNGFRPENLLRVEIDLPHKDYAVDARIRSFYQQLLQSAFALPGISSAALVSNTPASNVDNPVTPFTIRGRITPKQETPSAFLQIASAGYFDALRAPLVSGRFPTPADTENSQRVVVISRSMAQRFFPRGPLGQQIKLGTADSNVPWATIVGVVGDVRQNWWNPPESPTIYEPFPQAPQTSMCLVLRTVSDPASYAAGVRNTVSRIDAAIAPAGVNTLQNEVDDSIAIVRILGILMGVFGVVALLLSWLGVYGVLSERVAERVHEIGIRMALGATSRDVLALILGQSVKLTAIGIAIGVPLAVSVALVMNTAMYGVVELNYLVLAAFAVLLAAVALIAGYFPARRAMRVDPIAALRHE